MSERAGDAAIDGSGKAFAVNYTQARDDFAAMLRGQIKANAKPVNPAWRILRFAVFLAVGLLCGFGIAWLEDRGIGSFEMFASFFAGIVASLLAFFIYWQVFYVRHYAGKVFELNRLEGKRIDLRADDNGLYTETANSSAIYQWHAVERIDEDAERFMIWISGVAAVIVPKRAFDSEAESMTFGAALKEWTRVENK